MLARGIVPKEDRKVVEQSSRRLGLLWRRIRGDSKLAVSLPRLLSAIRRPSQHNTQKGTMVSKPLHE